MNVSNKAIIVHITSIQLCFTLYITEGATTTNFLRLRDLLKASLYKPAEHLSLKNRIAGKFELCDSLLYQVLFLILLSVGAVNPDIVAQVAATNSRCCLSRMGMGGGR